MPAPGGTLAVRLAQSLRSDNKSWEAAAAIAILLLLAPLSTIAGAKWLVRHERSQIAALNNQLAPRIAAAGEAAAARSALSTAVSRPTLGSSMEAVARGLPPDATLARAERTKQGVLEFDVATPDPDKLRAAIRRAPALATLRDSSQRQGDGGMLVSLREVAP